MRYSTESKGRKYVKGYGFLSFARNLVSSQAAKRARDTIVKQGKEAATRAGKRAINKAAEATGDLVGQKIADKIVKKASTTKKVPVQQEPQKDFTPEQRQQILQELSLL